MTYKTIAVKKETFALLDDCEIIYRKWHPEMERMSLSKEKLLYEIMKHYLKFTERAIK